MKTTLEIPDALFRRAKAAAAERGIPLRQLISDAVAEKLNAGAVDRKPWMRAFGALRDLREETALINTIIEEEFGRIDQEDWQ
jgi:hypothetical protein